MTVSYGKGPKGKATKLHSQIVRARGACENCGSVQNLQCAHVVTRKYSATRTDENAAFCLCATCHRRFTDWPLEWAEFVEAKLGRTEYDRLQWKAEQVTKVDWEAELERLKALWSDIGGTAA